jgi:hypothetical protein
MIPLQLTARDFRNYPPQAQSLAVKRLTLMQQLPLALLPSFLREIIGYDWMMPIERSQIETQLQGLTALTSAQLSDEMQGFTSLHLNSELEKMDWVNQPQSFIQQLSAWLWASHQMDAFHAIAESFNEHLVALAPPPMPSMARLGIVILGQGVTHTDYPLFRKLRPLGVFCSRIKSEDGLDVLLSHAASRAQGKQTQNTLSHWYIDGGVSTLAPGLTSISYSSLDHPRSILLNLTQQTMTSGSSGAEELRAKLARLKPEDLGFSANPADAVLNHFQLSVLAEGSGTQIFSTTFVQWAARECLRRAQPETIVLRYAPRQMAQPMNAMLSGAAPSGLDPEGSLIDADMGAYYTWLNFSRLSGAEQARFLVWFENQNQAFVIGPGLPKGTVSDSAMSMQRLLSLLT